MNYSEPLSFMSSCGAKKDTSLPSMTVDSIPISKLGQRGAGFMAAHVAFNTKAYAAIASPA